MRGSGCWRDPLLNNGRLILSDIPQTNSNAARALQHGVVFLFSAVSLHALSSILANFANGLAINFGVTIFALNLLPFLVLGVIGYCVALKKNWSRVLVLLAVLCLIFPAGLIRSVPFLLGMIRGQMFYLSWLYILSSAAMALSLLLYAFSLLVLFTRPASLSFKKN